MVRVTLSPPSDWTLTGSISGLGVRVWAWSDGAESADGSPANQKSVSQKNSRPLQVSSNTASKSSAP